MQPQQKLIDITVDDLVNSCQEDVEFRLPKLTWIKYMNDAIMNLYNVLFIEDTYQGMASSMPCDILN